MLRVLHEFGAVEITGITDEVARLRTEPGVASAEMYRSLARGEDGGRRCDAALTVLWETEEGFWAWWDGAIRGAYPALAGLVAGDGAATEFYARTEFALVDGTWVPAAQDESARRIFWPAAGAVRIIIQNAVVATEAMYDKIAVEIGETRREDGCEAYAWYENVDLPGHLLLLEVWRDQVIYDRHWHLRGATAAFVGDNLRAPVEPRRGPATREFYRRQQFRCHYDRWLPADPAHAATTISYPASR